MNFHYRRYLIEKAEQEAINSAYEELKQKPLEVVKRYKKFAEYKWKNRALLAKIWTFPYIPVRFIAADRIMDEDKKILEEKI